MGLAALISLSSQKPSSRQLGVSPAQQGVALDACTREGGAENLWWQGLLTKGADGYLAKDELTWLVSSQSPQ